MPEVPFPFIRVDVETSDAGILSPAILSDSMVRIFMTFQAVLPNCASCDLEFVGKHISLAFQGFLVG